MMGHYKNKRYTIYQKLFLKLHRKMPLKELTIFFNNTFNENRTNYSIHQYKKRHRYLSGRKSQFKKGNIPSTTKKVGTVRIYKNKYVEIKTAQPNVWKLKHIHMWETEYGKVPDGMVLKFKNGRDKINPKIENLELLSRHEILARNLLKCDQKPDNIQRTIKLIAKIAVETAKIKK